MNANNNEKFTDNSSNKNKKKSGSSYGTVSFPVSRKLLEHVILIILLIFFLFWLIYRPSDIATIVKTVVSVFSPFIFGLCLAFTANVLLTPLERLWNYVFKKCKGKIKDTLKRPLCLVLTYVILIGIVLAVSLVVLPSLVKTVTQIINSLPTYLATLDSSWQSLIEYFAKLNVNIPDINIDSEKLISTIQEFFKDYGESFLNKTITITASIFSTFLKGVIGLAFSIYVLAQKEKLGRQSTMAIKAVFKPRASSRILYLASESFGAFYRFITSQVLEAIIIGFLCLFGMLIFRMPYAGIISLLVGFTSLVPIFGAIFGTLIGAFLILLVSPIKALWFIVFIIVLQQIEGNLIYPKVVGKKVGLPGIWVLLSVTVGGEILGVFGMLISVPVCSVLYCLFRDFVRKKTKRRDEQQLAEKKHTRSQKNFTVKKYDKPKAHGSNSSSKAKNAAVSGSGADKSHSDEHAKSGSANSGNSNSGNSNSGKNAGKAHDEKNTNKKELPAVVKKEKTALVPKHSNNKKNNF